MALSTRITNYLEFVYTSAVGGTTGTFKPTFGGSATRATGVAKDQAQTVWYDKARSLATVTNDDIDLSGVKSDAFGATVTFTIVKGIRIENLSTVVGDELVIGNEGTNPFLLFKAASTATYTLGPGATFYIDEPCLAGLPVTAGTGDMLRIRNISGNTITYDICIWGV